MPITHNTGNESMRKRIATRWLIRLAALAVAVYAVICGLLYSAQDSLLYHPTGRDSKVPSFVLQRGSIGIVVSTAGPPSDRAVIYFGGNGEDVSRELPLLQRAFPDRSLYAMHYRGYGGSGGRPNEADIIGDALALHDQVALRHTRILLVGRSLGSGVAVQLAGRHPPERLVLVTPYDSVADIAAELFPAFPVRMLLRDAYDSRSRAASIHVPVTIIVASNDQVIPRKHSQRLADAFPTGSVRWIEIPSSDHNNLSLIPAYVAALAEASGQAGQISHAERTDRPDRGLSLRFPHIFLAHFRAWNPIRSS